jgi:hypothetical protein
VSDAIVSGVGQTDYTFSSGRSVGRLAFEAILSACHDAGISTQSIDGVITHPLSISPEEIMWGLRRMSPRASQKVASHDPGLPSHVHWTVCPQARVSSRHGWRPYWSRWTTVPTGLRAFRPYRPLGQPSVTMQHGSTVRGRPRIRRANVFDHNGSVMRAPPRPIDLAASKRFWALGYMDP